MRWGPFNTAIRDLRKWHTWYAWYPVKLSTTGEWVWLEKVDRSLSCRAEVMGAHHPTRYKDPGENYESYYTRDTTGPKNPPLEVGTSAVSVNV